MSLAIYLDQAQRRTWWFDRDQSAGKTRKQRRNLANADRRNELLGMLRRNGAMMLSDIAEETEETIQSVRSLSLPLIDDGSVRRIVMDGGYVALEINSGGNAT